jgi:hypothetical protein
MMSSKAWMPILMTSVSRQSWVQEACSAAEIRPSSWLLTTVGAVSSVVDLSTKKKLVQLLPHAEHIVVLEDGRITEKGSFEDLNASDGFVKSLGLKAAAIKEIEAVVAEEEEQEKHEKEALLEKEELRQEVVPKSDTKTKSRGKRNGDAMLSYIRSMGKVQFPIFVAFTVLNIGFRSAQRKSRLLDMLQHRMLEMTDFR